MKQVIHWTALLAAALGGVVLFGLAFAAADLGPTAVPGPSPTVEPSPTAWPLDLGPGEIQMPAGADCKACHETTGGVIGIKDIPAIPHPVNGWPVCTACHDNARLVQTAPGHSGIHADQCQICHTVSLGAAPPPAHPILPNADCLSCHGVTAPLPADMAHRPRQYCWLCHLSSNASPDSGWPVVGSPAPASLLPASS
jgi:hypothetical protein